MTTETQAREAPPDSLEHWRGLAMQQAETITANADEIRQLIHERDGYEPMTSCPRHGARILELAQDLYTRTTAHDRAAQARALISVAVTGLEYTAPEALTVRPPDQFTAWALGVLEKAAELQAEPPERDASPAPPIGVGNWAMPEGWVDPRRSVEYWRGIATNQAEALAEHAEKLDRYTRERDEQVAARSLCTAHETEITHLSGYVARVTRNAEPTSKALEILTKELRELRSDVEENGMPDGRELVAWAKRTGQRSDRTWRQQ